MARPVLPEAATRGDLAGQEAFIEYWFASVNYAIATGDTAAMMAEADAKCLECQDMKRQIDDIYSAGGHVEDGLYTLEFKVAVPPDETGTALPSVTFTQAAATDVTRDGMRDASPGERKTMTLVVFYEAQKWHVLGLSEARGSRSRYRWRSCSEWLDLPQQARP